MSEKCSYGETEDSCSTREYPKCGEGRCELSSRPKLEKYLKKVSGR